MDEQQSPTPPPTPGLDDISSAMKKFTWPDYVVFMFMLAICLVIGFYYGFFKKAKGATDYLVGGRNMSTVPVALSLIASYISGISLLGIPTEVYVYGIQYLYIVGAFFLMSLVMSYIFLPVFHDLGLTSTYEYLEKRFDRRVHLFGSLLFTISTITWLPTVIYVPALAFNQVTGLNVHYITPGVCVICIFYTSLGGIKAVVLSDVIQIVIMFAAIFLIAIKGTIDIGGLDVLIQRNLESGRIEGPNIDPNPMARHTVWSLVIGGFFQVMHHGAINQSIVQRYMALPSLKAARRALWFFFFGVTTINCVCTYLGLLIYASFWDCDPLTTTLAREKDQLLPLLVMVVLGNFPGLPGVSLAGNFSAALSSLSTGLNSMAAVVLEDFYKSFFRRDLTKKQTEFLMKMTVVIFGTLCVILVFVVERMGQVLQLQMSVSAISNGPALAIFTMGMLIPWTNGTGCLVGGVSSLVIMTFWCLRTTSLVASGDLTFPEKPVSIKGCHYHFTPRQSRWDMHFGGVNVTDVVHTDEQYMIYRLSYLWYTMVGTFLAIFIGLVVSFLTKPDDPQDIDPKLLAPFIRGFIKPRKFPNEPRDEIIFAYKSSKENMDNRYTKDMDKAIPMESFKDVSQPP